MEQLTRPVVAAGVTLMLGCVPTPADRASIGACSQLDSLGVPEAAVGGLSSGPHTAVWDGVRFWYCVSGQADSQLPTAVFLHGGPGEGSQHFASLTGPVLEEELRVVYFDQRGSGRSERPWRRDYDIDRLVDDIEELRKTLDVEELSLIAHSFGGLLALEYAAAYPSRVASLVMVAGLSDIPATGRSVCTRLESIDPAAYDRAMESPLPGGVCNSFAAYSGPQSERFARESMYPNPRVGELVDSTDRVGGLRNTGELSRAVFAMPDVFSYRFDDHERLIMPVLVVAGELDHQIGLEPQEALARDLPQATLLVIENAGHFPHVDDPEQFVDAVVSFLGQTR